MIVKEITESFDEESRLSIEISIDGVKVFAVHDGEPEDNNLYRNFNDCVSITHMMEIAYNAGKAGESFKIESEMRKGR